MTAPGTAPICRLACLTAATIAAHWVGLGRLLAGLGHLRLERGKALIAILATTLLLAGCSSMTRFDSPTALAAVDGMALTEDAPLPTAPSPPPAAIAPDGAPAAVLSYAEAIGPSGDVDVLMAYYADAYSVPLGLVRRVAQRESNFNPAAHNGRYWGLMQIQHATARTMGYRGVPEGLLDPDTNLKYAVKYLAGAYLVARGDDALADRFYQRGYYYDAKRMGLLEETGLRP